MSNDKVCIAFRKYKEKMVRMAIFDKNFNLLAETLCPTSDGYRGFHLVELNKAILLCLFDKENGEDVSSTSLIKKYDIDLKLTQSCKVDGEINYADVHENKLYLLVTRPDRKSKLICV